MADDGDREDEGDLVMAAACVTPERIAFMASFGRGIICVPMEGPALDALPENSADCAAIAAEVEEMEWLLAQLPEAAAEEE